MSAQELIESGIIEVYVLGIAAEDERELVETLAKTEERVRLEIASVNDALANYASMVSLPVAPDLRNKIFSYLESSNDRLPPKLTSESKPEEWITYLQSEQLSAPSGFKGIYFLELPGNDGYYSYAVWGNVGGYVEEESHSLHKEYLLVCSGECEMTINGKTSQHKAGDYIEILPGIPHSARVTGKEAMLVVGQRRVA